MITFADDPDLYGHSFGSGWGARAETAIGLAERIQTFVRLLGQVETEWTDLWPILTARSIRTWEPHVLQMSRDDLATLIDRRARFDPPMWPAPVGDAGYSLVLGANRIGIDPMKVGVMVHAGDRVHRAYPWNEVRVRPHDKSPIWQDRERGHAIVRGIIECFDPDWVLAAATQGPLVVPIEGRLPETWLRPWFSWALPGSRVPKSVRTSGDGVLVDTIRGGELRWWA